MLDYSFNEFVIVYSLYFFFHYLFRGGLKKKKAYIGFTNLKIEWEN